MRLPLGALAGAGAGVGKLSYRPRRTGVLKAGWLLLHTPLYTCRQCSSCRRPGRPTGRGDMSRAGTPLPLLLAQLVARAAAAEHRTALCHGPRWRRRWLWWRWLWWRRLWWRRLWRRAGPRRRRTLWRRRAVWWPARLCGRRPARRIRCWPAAWVWRRRRPGQPRRKRPGGLLQRWLLVLWHYGVRCAGLQWSKLAGEQGRLQLHAAGDARRPTARIVDHHERLRLR